MHLKPTALQISRTVGGNPEANNFWRMHSTIAFSLVVSGRSFFSGFEGIIIIKSILSFIAINKVQSNIYSVILYNNFSLFRMIKNHGNGVIGK